jgi:hypothetical protein
VLTPFADLDAVLDDVASAAREILQETFVGFYLQGSFALGAGDAQSDADFVAVTTVLPGGDREAALRRLHADLPDRPGTWARNIEGSYADAESLRGRAGLGTPWLYVDRGHRRMQWDEHCNTLHTRWILRASGISLAGPPARDLVDEVPTDAMRAAAAAALPGTLAGILAWAPPDHAWTQRYIVQTCCRVLYTARTGGVASKPAALAWAGDTLDPRWRPLLAQVAADRASDWQPVDPPRPGSMAQAVDFAAYVEALEVRL